MGVAVNPCVDSAVGDVVAKFCGKSNIQRVAGIPLVNGCECRKVMCHDHNLFSIAQLNGILYESEVLFKRICYVFGGYIESDGNRSFRTELPFHQWARF